jgi:hypothetical protein
MEEISMLEAAAAPSEARQPIANESKELVIKVDAVVVANSLKSVFAELTEPPL